MGHVLARLNGFGTALLPRWPYSFERERDDADSVRVTRWTASGTVRTLVQPGQRVADDAVDVVDGLDVPYWLVETSIFRVRWPRFFSVESPQDEGDDTPFYLHGPGQATIFPQGPVGRDQVAGPDALVAADQTVVARRADGGVDVVELNYRHDNEPWWQAHWTIPYGNDQFVVPSTQSLETSSARTREAAQLVVTSFESSR